MGTDLIIAIVAITMALILYTIGVWWEHRDKELRRIHLIFFIMGLVCDMTGTTVMSMMASDSKDTGTLMSAHQLMHTDCFIASQFCNPAS